MRGMLSGASDWQNADRYLDMAGFQLSTTGPRVTSTRIGFIMLPRVEDMSGLTKIARVSAILS